MEWIDITEKRPNSEDRVLITIKAGALDDLDSMPLENETTIAWYVDNPDVDGRWYPTFYFVNCEGEFMTKDIIAWMPLPEPYGGKRCGR